MSDRMTASETITLCLASTPDGPCRRPRHRRGHHDPDPPTLRVPRDDQGRPQVSITQLRRYGAVDLAVGGEDHAETVRGCPRSYAKLYSGDQPIPEFPSRAAEMGSVLHRALALMEDASCGPQEALGRVWPATLGVGDYGEALRVLDGYLARGGPMTMYATLATELDITAELFVDDEHGPVMFRGIIDILSVDASNPNIIHCVDYKSGGRPISKDSLRGDVQLMGYTWLVLEWWKRQHGVYPSRVVAHFDQLRYSDLAIEYTAHELELWREWASAMVRTMLRDEYPQPILNHGCGWCPVNWSCPAWLALPGEAESASVRLAGATPELLGERYIAAVEIKKLLDDQVDAHKRALEAETEACGSLIVGDQEWRTEAGSKVTANVLGLVDLLLPDHPGAFATAVIASKSSVGRAAAELDDFGLAEQVVGCVVSVRSGWRIAKRKVKKN